MRSNVVGAQLGQRAISTSLQAGAVAIAAIAVLMIAIFWVPGVAAALALALYVCLIICLISAFDITMTLPGIAGIILSIGMAVDANVIIFTRIREEIASSYLLANATGVGMKPLEGQTWLPDASYLRPDLIVTDTVYAPAETEFLRIAKEVGCKNMNGFGMMLFQGAAGFKMWTGQDMPIEHMKEVLGIKYGD